MTNEELQEKLEQLASEMDWIKTKLVDLLEEKGLAPVKTSYEVEFPEGLEKYYILDEVGRLSVYTEKGKSQMYIRGLTFKTEEDAKRYDKERRLLFKLHKWAEEHNGGWTLNWKANEPKYYVTYDYYGFSIKWSYLYNNFIKLPYFKSREIAEQFIDEFGDEIVEVLC